jgi:hypothetical protein
MLCTGGQHPDGGAGTLREGSGSAPSPSLFLRKRTRVGSIHTQLNYDRVTERATHTSEMPLPSLAARQAKAAMKAADATRWHGETQTFRPAERRSMENFRCDPTEYKMNFRAEELPQPRPVVIDAFGTVQRVLMSDHFHRTIEMPVHSALAGKAGWNSSTQVPFAERVRQQEAKDARHRAAAAQATLRLTGGGRAYEGPKQREDRRCAETRAAKAALAEAAAPQVTDEARAATLRWTANFKDAQLRLDPISPAPSMDSLATAASQLLGSSVLQGGAEGAGGSGSSSSAAWGNRKPPTNLEKRYLTIVREEIRGLGLGSRLENKVKPTRWCYGSL